MEPWSALILGFLGSIHCIGMCGPIALALPAGYNSVASLTFSRIVYNSGRIVTYMLFGVIVGFAGEGLAMAGLQQKVSLVAGALLAIAIIIPSRITRKALPNRVSLALQRFTEKLFESVGAQRGLLGLFGIGIANGFLPCGFVYLALAGALSVGGVSGSVLYMMAFGLGTVPAMLAVSLGGGLLTGSLRKRLSSFFPVVGLALAALLMLRGLALGIPYISPDLSASEASERGCCATQHDSDPSHRHMATDSTHLTH